MEYAATLVAARKNNASETLNEGDLEAVAEELASLRKRMTTP
jgi:hypothetical protein